MTIVVIYERIAVLATTWAVVQTIIGIA